MIARHVATAESNPASDFRFVASMALWFLIALTLAGCNGSAESTDSGSNKNSGKPAENTQLKQPPTPALDELQNRQNTGDLKLPPADNKTDDNGDTVRNPTDEVTKIVRNDRQPSALDAAIEKINREPTDRGDVLVIEATEPHEELKPLLKEGWIRLHQGMEVWLDPQEKQVIVGGRICFRDGPLEMFACPMNTKEHESIVSTVSNAEIIHTGLLAAGAIPGKPFQWDPEYVPASGPVVHITVLWHEDGNVRESTAQEMVQDIVTQKPLEHDWVFCGSGEWRDPENPSYREYWADSGDMICVTNFTTAMLDLQIESSSMAEGLRYHANPDKIPPLGKPVLLVLKPVIDDQPIVEGQ